jgi:N-acetyl-beta-hexosaminidase
MEAPATYWGFCYTKPGHEKGLIDVMNEYVELYKSKNLPAGFESYVALTGAELPAYMYVMRGKTLTDLFGSSEKSEKIVGEEAQALWKKFASHLRKYEYKLGMFRPDLSYMPEQQ